VIAVIPVRGGALPLGADEAIAECGGHVLLIGESCRTAAAAIAARTHSVRVTEVGSFAPAGWAEALASIVAEHAIVLFPASPDGRDLAPHLAHALGRPLWAGAARVTPDEIVASRHGGRALLTAPVDEPIVATLIPGVRAVETAAGKLEPTIDELPLAIPTRPAASVVGLLRPLGATMDLADAPRIVAGGAGLGSEETFGRLADLAGRLDASVGATRVVVDRGWTPHSRQIGTTGAVVAPELYLAFGISGAVQHLSGVEPATHTIAVNLDPSCPMMTAADLAVVSDAPAVLEALIEELATPAPREASPHA
jgi:electron transfer flavoprotein alpha subunit